MSTGAPCGSLPPSPLGADTEAGGAPSSTGIAVGTLAHYGTRGKCQAGWGGWSAGTGNLESTKQHRGRPVSFLESLQGTRTLLLIKLPTGQSPLSTNRAVCCHPSQAVHGITQCNGFWVGSPTCGPRRQIPAGGTGPVLAPVSHPEAGLRC